MSSQELSPQQLEAKVAVGLLIQESHLSRELNRQIAGILDPTMLACALFALLQRHETAMISSVGEYHHAAILRKVFYAFNEEGILQYNAYVQAILKRRDTQDFSR